MFDRKAFFAALRSRGSGVFGTSLSQPQVDGISGILDAFASHGDGNPKTLAYALATAYHETGRRMVPVREGFASTDAGARRAVNALARKRGPGSAAARYSQPTGKYGHVYYGRGHVQLTWIDNYRDSSNDAGYDLVAYPDQMLDPVISARVLIRGLMDGRWNGQRKGVGHYLPKDGPDDLRNARRTVNVTDKWRDIAGYYQSFMAAIKAAGGIAGIATPAIAAERPGPGQTMTYKLPPGSADRIIVTVGAGGGGGGGGKPAGKPVGAVEPAPAPAPPAKPSTGLLAAFLNLIASIMEGKRS